MKPDAGKKVRAPFETEHRLLLEMLRIEGLPVRASYTPGEVCRLLNIGDRTFWRLTNRYEVGLDGGPTRPDALDSFLLHRERRVRFHELSAYLKRNQCYERQHAYRHYKHQMALF